MRKRLKQNQPRQLSQLLAYCLGLALLLGACGKEEMEVTPISLLSLSANGLTLTDGATNVPTTASLELTFSGALAADKFAAAVSLNSPTGKVPVQLSYTNASSKAIINAGTLAFGTRYTLQVPATVIGQRGETLDRAIAITFTTQEEGPVTEMAPCVSASADCLQTLSLAGNNGTTATFDYYSSYPIFLEKARWEKLRSAVVVVHGQNRDAPEYFSYMMATLRQEKLENNTILIAPFFKSSAEAKANDLQWSTSGWREGQGAATTNAPISSFTVIDRLIAQLANKDRFPVLEKIIITGHSSGALFTQLYAAANRAENSYPGISFSYVVANSQYFYYPLDLRYNEGSGQFFTPTNCPAFNRWPLGYTAPPAYLQGTQKADVDRQLTQRDVIYLLGNGGGADGTLNTTDCEATLLGSTRFKRGSNMFLFLETNYAATHKSRKVIVNGIGHDGQGMYQSPEFRTLLKGLMP
ncbi:MAG: Ig-like domain-containing protein [Lewinellaceae bacterium]|nr:Ig-like domain-containing protein [Lewinellaceae bacterium]